MKKLYLNIFLMCSLSMLLSENTVAQLNIGVKSGISIQKIKSSEYTATTEVPLIGTLGYQFGKVQIGVDAYTSIKRAKLNLKNTFNSYSKLNKKISENFFAAYIQLNTAAKPATDFNFYLKAGLGYSFAAISAYAQNSSYKERTPLSGAVLTNFETGVSFPIVPNQLSVSASYNFAFSHKKEEVESLLFKEYRVFHNGFLIGLNYYFIQRPKSTKSTVITKPSTTVQ